MALIKKLTKIGNSYGIILPSEILKVAGVEDNSEVEISVHENKIILKPTNLKHHQVMKAFLSVIDQYEETLKKLAE